MKVPETSLAARLPSAARAFTSMLLVLLLAGCGNGYLFTGDHTDKSNYALAILPAAPVVTTQHTIQLSASSPWGTGAVWSVLPATLGSIDANGKLTASVNAGTGTVVAMFQNDVRYTATAALTIVAAPVVNLLLSPSTVTVNASDTASVAAQAIGRIVSLRWLLRPSA